MADYVEKLQTDLLEQFKDKSVITAIVETIGEQLNDVYDYYADLRDYRGVQTSIGRQLDGVGDIVVLTRKEAGELACLQESVFVLEDEEYRKYLVYKIWKNTCNCTYRDIIKAFRMFWDRPLYYSETPERPATMVLETDELPPEVDVQKLLNAPFIKAAGVEIKVIAYTKNPLMAHILAASSVMGRGYQSTTLPEIGIDYNFENAVRPVPAARNLMQTILPEMEE